MTRAAGERVRLAHAFQRARAVLTSLELNAGMDGAGLLNAAQALALVSSEILVLAARADAYERADGAL